MSEKTAIWDKLGKTDPAHTKGFTRGGGFKGTAIKPMWSYRRMTEEFGPAGKGWGVNQPVFQVVPGNEGEMLVYCTVSVWWENPDQFVYGVGGDKVVAKFSSGLKSDDEAFKKAFTDAVTNALKLIGVGADVHMGMFDDSKYVNSVAADFAAEKPASSASLKREDAWKKVMDELHNDLVDCHSIASLNKLRADYRAKVRDYNWPAAWLGALRDEFDAAEDKLKEVEEAA